MSQGINNAIFEFCMRHSDDPSGSAEGLPERDPKDYEWLRNALAEIKSDYERMENCMKIVTNKEVTDVSSKEVAMEEVLYFVEDLDNAVDFAKKLKAGPVMLQVIGGEGVAESLVEGAANILGTVAQNNIICQAILLTDGALPVLVNRLMIDEGKARTKLIYAISSIIRGNKDIITAFFNTPNAVPSITSVLNHHASDPRAARKALFFLTCLWRDIPDMPKPPIPQSPTILEALKALLSQDSPDIPVDYAIQLVKHGAKAAMEAAGINPTLVKDEHERKRLQDVW